MIKYWSLEKKSPFFLNLIENLKDSSKPALPIYQLFEKMIADQKDRVTYTSGATKTYTSVSGGTTLTSYSYTRGNS